MRRNLFIIISIILVFSLLLQCGLSVQAFACSSLEKEDESRKEGDLRQGKESQGFKYMDSADRPVLLSLPRFFSQSSHTPSAGILKDILLFSSKPFNHSPPLAV